MIIVGWAFVAFAAWLLDSAIRNRPPIETLKEIVTTGALPVVGKTYPTPAHVSVNGASGAAYSGGAPVGTLDAEQAANARAIASVAWSRGLGRAGVVIGIMTALTESTLHNVGHGDAMGPSSRGLFQQMPSWGPMSVRMDPAGSAGLFFNALQKTNWQNVSPQMAAQRVQQSEFSDGSNYAKNYAWAQAIATSLGY